MSDLREKIMNKRKTTHSSIEVDANFSPDRSDVSSGSFSSITSSEDNSFIPKYQYHHHRTSFKDDSSDTITESKNNLSAHGTNHITPIKFSDNIEDDRPRSIISKKRKNSLDELRYSDFKRDLHTPGHEFGNRSGSFSRKIEFIEEDRDIDIRNDPDYTFDYGKRYCNSSNYSMKDCEEKYVLAKNLRSQKKRLTMVQNENFDLRWRLEDLNKILAETRRKLRNTETNLRTAEDVIKSNEIKMEENRDLIKDLVRDNKRKKEYIYSLEKDIDDAKRIKRKLEEENSLIRSLGKEISDDSDNLLKTITTLKGENKNAVEKIKSLEAENAKLSRCELVENSKEISCNDKCKKIPLEGINNISKDQKVEDMPECVAVEVNDRKMESVKDNISNSKANNIDTTAVDGNIYPVDEGNHSTPIRK